MALELTEANFEDLVLNSDKPALVDFFGLNGVDLVEWLDQSSMKSQLIMMVKL